MSELDTQASGAARLPGAEEHHRMVEEWNRTEAEYPSNRCIHQLFEEVAARTPDAVAVVGEDESLSYRELNERANRLANHLRGCGVGPEVRVAICLERSPEMVVCILGVLKAGGAYVPLDPTYPTERLEWMLADSGAAVLLLRGTLRELPPVRDGVRVLGVDAARAEIEAGSAENPRGGATPQNLAYVIYTSGSTGRPKGVMNAHGAVVNRLCWMHAELGIRASDVVLQKTPFSFDVSVWEFFWPLQQGARVVMARPEGHRDPVYLQEVIERRGVTTLHFVPSMLAQFLETADAARCASLRRVVCSGEALPPELVERFHARLPPPVALYNLYGPTEAAVDVSCWPCERQGPVEAVPIGRPVWNTRLYVLDGALQPVAAGVPGELYIGGVQVARGYLGRADLTAERFVPDPFAPCSGARLYRTGDEARWRGDGALEYLGRLDRQVKIRGFRIEPGEIEAVLRRHPAVQDVVVADYEHAPGDRRLATYVVPDAARAPALRRLLELERTGALSGHRVESLPDGTDVVSLNPHETAFLYEEIVERGAYLRHGIDLPDGACVFDVGANIGLFTLAVARRSPRSRVYAFEPIPPVCEALRLNAAVHGGDVRVLECALADVEGEAPFTFYPNASVLSGRHAEPAEERAVVRAFLRNEAGGAPRHDGDGLDALLEERLSTRTFRCRLRTLSQVIREEGVERIDLLKVDVEKSELEVLAGIEDGDWDKIRQVAMEVHDTGGRLQRVRALLEGKGFDVRVEQDAALSGTPLHDLYALRPGRGEPGPAASVVGAGVDGDGERWNSAAGLSQDLRRMARERLPEHMVPGAIVPLAALPLTPNGKLDRNALPAPRAPAGPVGAYVAPRTPVEEALAAIWVEVLGIERVGVDQPFLALGGHSLLAMRVLARISDAFGVHVAPHVLLRSGTLEEIAAVVGAAAREPASPAPALARVPRDRPIPLSFSQEAAWFFEQFAPGLMAYRAQSTVRIRGALDVPALERALTEIVRRHEIFRTTTPLENGVPVQRIHAPWRVRLPVRDLSALEEPWREAAARGVVLQDFLRPFDVTALPLVWWSLVRLSADEHVFPVVEHHFVHDGWSVGVFLRELRELYTAFLDGRESPLPEPPVQFADFAVWQRRWVESGAAEAGLRFWEAALAGAPSLALPTDFPRPAVMRFRGARERVRLSPALAAEARAFSREHGSTFFATLMAAFQALLGRYSGQRDFCVGSGLGNRRHVALEDVIGMVVNTVAIRADLGGDPPVAELLRRVRETTLRAYEHQDVPFDQVVRRIHPERSASALPVYQVAFSFHDSPMGDLSFAGLRLEIEEALDNGSAKSDVSVIVIPRAEQGVAGLEDEVVMVWEYDTDLFEPGTIRRMIGHYRTLLAELVRHPGRPFSELALMDAEERARVVEAWSGTGAAEAPELLVHEQFGVQAARAPDAPAIVSGDRTLTYGALDERAARLASFLRRRGVGPDVRVGVCLERGPELVVALLGVLRAGGAYVAMDPGHPPERLAFLAEDSGVAALLTQDALRGALPVEPGVEVVCLDGRWAEVAAEPADRSGSGAEVRSLAYVLYTSGSTGAPKGVAVEHGALRNLCAWYARTFGVTEADRMTQLISAGFDGSAAEIWTCLSRGACLQVVPDDVRADPERLRDWLVGRRSTITTAPVAIAEPLLALPWPADTALRWLLAGADRLTARPGAAVPFALSNNYGPTECTVICTSGRVEAEGARAPSIGRPVDNARAYVLDPGMRPLPAGVPGELYVGGVQVARGYLGRPGPTAERFVPDPFAGRGGRLYRTGDRVRWLADGTLEFLGRLDQQVKVRGIRIEPGEIEAALRRAPGVADCAVVARADAVGGTRLAAYVVGGADGAALRAHLRRTLPEYMVPADLVAMAALPVTPNGKLDRNALPAPQAAPADAEYVPPATEAEDGIARIWQEVLDRERIGVHDDFFALGGDSLLATRVVIRTRDVLGREVPLAALFDHRTLAAFAEAACAARPREPLSPAGDLVAGSLNRRAAARAGNRASRTRT